MPEVVCPHCNHEFDPDWENFPQLACDQEDYDCPECEEPVVLGWYAVPTIDIPRNYGKVGEE